MAEQSTMTKLGIKAPAFDLPDVSTGRRVRLEDFADSKGLLVMFICRHCPYVQHIKDELGKLGRDYASSDVAIVAISCNDAVAYPADSPQSLAEFAAECGITYPVLYDESQEVAKAYGAACTPDFFLFNADRDLVYRGRLDESRPNSGIPVTGKELRAAMDAVVAGRSPASDQLPSIGCSIKWK